MNMLVSILWFLLIFCVVVVSHEFGHFIIAKANGIKVLEFYVGFGPKIIHWKKGDTEYSVRLIPLGGACVFAGMDAVSMEKSAEDGEKSEPEKGSFLAATVWSRFATVIAGPVFNVILGFIIAFIMVNMIAIREPVVTEVLPGGAAEKAGLEAGDRIVSLNGEKVCLYDDLVLYTTVHEGEDIVMVYERDGKKYSTVLAPLFSEEYGRYMIGISNADFAELKGADSIKYAWYEVRYNLKMTYSSLYMLVRGKVKSTDVAGPVGIAVNVVGETYAQTKAYGIKTVVINMMNIALMLTINIGILNLLPVPALDGGRLLFLIIEMLRGKPVPQEKEALVHFVGIIFFLILVVFIFFNDIRNIFF